MTTNVLAEFGPSVKPNAALAGKVYPRRMGRRRKVVRYEESKSGLQTVFVRNLVTILEDRGLSDNALAELIAPGNAASVQRSVSRITACLQDPGLEKVDQIASALGLPVSKLFEGADLVRKRTPLVKGAAAEQHVNYSTNSAKQTRQRKDRKTGHS